MLQALRIWGARRLVSDSIEEWFVHIKNLSLNTQDYYKKVLSEFAATIPNKPIDKLTTKDLRSYLLQNTKGRKKSTMNNQIVALKSFCRFVSETYDIDNPSRNIKKLRIEGYIQRFLTRKQYEKLLSVAKGREFDILTLIGNTGLRASEACSLTWDSVSPQLTRITIVGKNSRVRVIPLNQSAKNVLLKYPRKAGTHINFLPKSRQGLGYICRGVGQRCGIPCNPHALRHYVATELLRKGVQIALVSELMGASIRVIENHYRHILPDYLIGVTDVLDG
jgi:integrase/recombinase XerD